MRQLTQEILEPYKPTVTSAAVDSYGAAWGFTAEHIAGETGWNEVEPAAAMSVVLIGYGYDATNWQNSAINREVTQ